MDNKQNLQLYFKEFIKTDYLPFKGIGKTKKIPDYVCDLFVYEPKNVEEVQLGSLFMLGRIENIPRNKYKSMDLLLSLLISVIKREFYSDHKLSTVEAFEYSLNKANFYLADFAEKGNNEWIGNLHFICGAFSQNTLHISKVGKSTIKLFRGTRISNIENKFPNKIPPHPLKTFNNIASGLIINGDKIILAIKDILDITSVTSLKNLTRGNCHQIIEGLKNLAEEKSEKVPKLCLAIESRMGAPEEIISCIPNLKDIKESKLPKKIITVFIVFKKISTIILFICRQIYIVLHKIFSFIVFVFRQIYKFFVPVLHSIFKWLFRKISKTDPFQHKLVVSILSFWKNASSKIKNNYKNLKTQNRPAFFVASLLTVLLLFLPFLIAEEINYKIKIKNFYELSAEIQEIQKKADTALIYSEKEKAKGLIYKNQTLLMYLADYLKSSFLKNNKELLETANRLQEKYQEQLDSVDNIKRIKNIEEILDISLSGFIINPAGMEKIKDNLYFYELDSGILYRFNLNAEKKDLILIFISAKDELRKMIALETGQIVLFGQSGKVYLYGIDTDDYNTYLFDPAVSVDEIKDLKNFSSNFYILDVGQGNIIKYSLNKKEEDIFKGESWLAKPIEELKNAQSMAIDGSIYVLDVNGTITEYFRGEKTNQIDLNNEASLRLVSRGLKKPLGKDNKIFIRADFKNFYISDPQNNRLIVLNKKGEVVNQYVNDEFSELKDFLVTADEKEIYLLRGKKVYKFGL